MKEKLTSMIALASATVASICCFGPLVLVGLGLGGAGFAARFSQYRPYFLGFTAVLLVLAFFLTYRKRKVTCADGRCEFRAGSKGAKATLWIIAILSLGIITFPHWSPLFIKTQAATIDPGAELVIFSVSGMTCPACAVSIENSLKELPGVEAVSVDSDTEEANIYIMPGTVSTDEIMKEIEEAGPYSAKLKQAG